MSVLEREKLKREFAKKPQFFVSKTQQTFLLSKTWTLKCERTIPEEQPFINETLHHAVDQTAIYKLEI